MMGNHTYPNFPTAYGYMTEQTRSKYIDRAIMEELMPSFAHRVPKIVSLDASNDSKTPIQFWQLFSVLGQYPIVSIIRNFYERVFDDEHWFRTVFERVGPVNHHVNTQAAMWLDVMGAGPIYHGGEYRLNFHHTHNAFQIMTEDGAKKWVGLMVDALEDSDGLMTNDPRVRLSINTFLAYFFAKYASDFSFRNLESFGEINPPTKVKLNFMNMTSDEVEAFSEEELRDALIGRGVDVSAYGGKPQLVNKALSL